LRRRGDAAAAVAPRLRRGAALGAVLGALAAAAGTGPAAADGTPAPYAFTAGALPVAGGAGPADAARLVPGRTYRGSLPHDGKQYYRLDLDAGSTAYVSATAVPPSGAVVSAGDGVRVSVRDADGTSCSFRATRFGAGRSPHPITAWGVRESTPGARLCQGAGAYYVVVERLDANGSSPAAWDLELTTATEPRLRHTTPTEAPEATDTPSPAPMTGTPVRRAGGAGFAGAAAVGQGVWTTGIRPGQTLFYKVPVDWGRRLGATAELAAAGGTGSGYVTGALSLSLYNPVRGYVTQAATGYRGARESAALEPLPPVAYVNRYAIPDQVAATRFAGWYYLAVHLAAQTADRFGPGPYGLTLRVRLSGAARPGPGYAGASVPRNLFEVTDEDRGEAAAAGAGGAASAGGGGGDGDGRRLLMTVLAAGGIGGGTALLTVLGVWTVSARRRAGAR
jgi:hypothetical protein